jgi:hypothetical protein
MKDGHTLSVLHSAGSDTQRADLAKFIKASTVEAVGGQSERAFYEALRKHDGLDRMEGVLKFAGSVYRGAEVAEKRIRVGTLLNKPIR